MNKKLESITSQEIEGDNDDSMKNQKILQLKNENDRLKLIENKYKEIENENNKYKIENEELKKELEFSKLQKDNVNNSPYYYYHLRY